MKKYQIRKYKNYYIIPQYANVFFGIILKNVAIICCIFKLYGWLYIDSINFPFGFLNQLNEIDCELRLQCFQGDSMEVGGEAGDDSMEIDEDKYFNRTGNKLSSIIPPNVKLKFIKPLLGASSRLGRALAELFGLLVKVMFLSLV